MTEDKLILDTDLPYVDEDKDYLSDLVGDGRKYKDEKALAKGNFYQDEHIKKLEREMKGLREDLNARLSLEQLTDKITELKNTSLSATPNHGERQDDDNKSSKPTPNLEDIERLFDEKITKREQARVKTSNLDYVRSELKKAFGNNYASKISEESGKLGLGEEFLNTLAAEQPKAFLKLFVQERVPFGHSAPPRSELNLFTEVSGKRDEAYYKALKQKYPSEYWSPKIQNQMHNDAIRMGEEFFVQ